MEIIFTAVCARHNARNNARSSEAYRGRRICFDQFVEVRFSTTADNCTAAHPSSGCLSRHQHASLTIVRGPCRPWQPWPSSGRRGCTASSSVPCPACPRLRYGLFLCINSRKRELLWCQNGPGALHINHQLMVSCHS